MKSTAHRRRTAAERASAEPRETPAPCLPRGNRLDPSLRSVMRVAAEWEGRIESALSTVELSGAKFQVLQHLASAGAPLALSELAEHAACVRSNITQLIDRLEADGLVERVDDPNDRRVIRAQITSLGQARYAAGAELLDAVSADFAAAIPAPDRAVLGRLLSRLH